MAICRAGPAAVVAPFLCPRAATRAPRSKPRGIVASWQWMRFAEHTREPQQWTCATPKIKGIKDHSSGPSYRLRCFPLHTKGSTGAKDRTRTGAALLEWGHRSADEALIPGSKPLSHRKPEKRASVTEVAFHLSCSLTSRENAPAKRFRFILQLETGPHGTTRVTVPVGSRVVWPKNDSTLN